MDTKISEEDLLSGVELLPTTEPNTPNNLLESSSKLEDSSVGILSDKSSPTKSLHLISPTKMSTGAQSFSDTALKVQKRLHESLASSLRKEVEIKASWQASPGEICMRDFHKDITEKDAGTDVENSQHSKASDSASVSVLHKSRFLTLPSTGASSDQKQQRLEDNDKRESSECSLPRRGPNVCLSDQFPSGISPIKTYEQEDKQPSLRSQDDENQAFGEDPNTKKLLEYIQKLEKGSTSDETLADRLNQLSFLLKNSSMNLDTDIDESQNKLNLDSGSKSTQPPGGQSNIGCGISKSTISSNKAINQKTKVSSKQSSHRTTAMKKTVQIKDPNTVPHQPKSTKYYSTTSSQPINSKNNQAGKHGNRSHKGKKSAKLKEVKVAAGDAHVVDTLQQHSTEPSNGDDVNKPPSRAVQEMDKVRDHLQTMLSFHKINPLSLDLSTSHTAHESKDDDTFRSNDTATLLRVQPSELIPLSPQKDGAADLTDSLTSGLFSILKTGHSKQPPSGRSSIDSSLTAENGMLRDTLEKETYRRKHCEKQIQKLQKKMLDVQQELAVAHSTDRKKDLMIEQLDKTLAKVVESWKSHEAGLVRSVEQLTQEKEKYKVENVKLKEMLVSLENELAKVLEELVDEKERILRFEEKEKLMQISYQSRAEEISKVIDQKNEKLHQLQQKNEELVEEKKFLQQTVDELAQDTKNQKDAFVEKEAKWSEAVTEIEKRQKELLQNEKALTDQERKRCSNIQSALASTDEEVARLKELLEAQRSEMESMHTQAAIAEAKHQGDLQKMEAEHKIHIERQIMEKLSQVYEESQSNEARIRETHKKQVLELMESHKRELECQCRRYEDELQKRDTNLRKAITEHEKSATEKLKLKSEDMRQQMMNKMQNLLQTHYNETLQVVGNTAGVTPPRAQVKTNQPRLGLSHDTSLVTSTTHNFRTVGGQQETDFRRSLAEHPQSHFNSVLPQTKPIILQQTLPLGNQHPPAFSLSTSGPLVSSFQPVTSGLPTQGPPLSSLEEQESYHQDQLPVPVNSVVEHLEIEEEALPNLSLLSSISHSTATTMPHEFLSTRATVETSQRVNSHLHPSVASTLAGQHVTTSGVSTHGGPTRQDEEAIRKIQLQHYVQMLLQRSPGAPVDTATTAGVTSSKDDDKENAGLSTAYPVTSYPVSNILMHVTNQHNEASPDLVPVKQEVPGSVPELIKPQTVPISRVAVSSQSVFGDPKRSVRFADTPSAPPHPSISQSTPAFLNQAQMSEISQMLGLYSTSDTPSGETKLAAEQLLSYLRLNNTSSALSKSSVQPSVTSSPVKKNSKRIEQHPQDGSLLHPSGKPMKLKTGISPAKPVPAWR